MKAMVEKLVKENEEKEACIKLQEEKIACQAHKKTKKAASPVLDAKT